MEKLVQQLCVRRERTRFRKYYEPVEVSGIDKIIMMRIITAKPDRWNNNNNNKTK